MQKDSISFDKLKLLPGNILQLQVGANAKALKCRYVGAVTDRYLILTQPRGAKLRGGQQLLVKAMLPKGIGMFKVSVESITALPMPLIYLSYPKSVACHDIRSARRVDIVLPIEAWSLSAVDGDSTNGNVDDLSVTGAKVSLRKVLAQVGDKIKLQADVDVGGLSKQLIVTGTVRSRIDRSTEEETSDFPAVYGVEFCDVDEDNKLLLHTYIYQAIVGD